MTLLFSTIKIMADGAELPKTDKVKTKGQPRPGIVLFYRTADIYSQFHPSNFTVDGVEYSCCEQYMMHQV